MSLSRSSCNSLNSSQSDVTSLPKTISDKTVPSPTAKSDESHQRLLSLQTTHQNLKNAYQYLLRQFDLMTVLNQYFLNEVKLDEKQIKTFTLTFSFLRRIKKVNKRLVNNWLKVEFRFFINPFCHHRISFQFEEKSINYKIPLLNLKLRIKLN